MTTILGGSGWDYASALADFSPAATDGVGSTLTTNTPFSSGRRVSLRASPDADIIVPRSSSAVSEIWLHTWVLLTNELRFVFRDSAGSDQCHVRVGLTATEAYRGYSSPTLLGTSSTYSSIAATLVYLQIRVVVSTTVGIIQVYRDLSSTPLLNLTGQNTQATANANTQSVACFTAGFGGDTVLDDTFLTASRSVGYLRGFVLAPGANGALTDFATLVGSASQFGALTQAPNDGDTTYIADGVANRTTLVKLSSTSPIGNKVVAVRPLLYGRRTGSAGSMACRTTIGSYAADLGTTSLGTSYGLVAPNFLNTNPNTSAAWLLSDLTSLEWGPKVISATGGDLRATSAFLEVIADLGETDNSVGSSISGSVPIREAQFLI